MKEIEVKVIEINKELVLEKLLELNAQKIGEYDIRASIFDDVEKSFKKKKQLIRLREKGKTFITFKGKAINGFVREAEEIEFEVSDFVLAKKFLEKIGLIAFELKPKHRTSFKIKNALIEIDEYEEIPVFLEIEAESEEKIREIIKLLELPIDNVRNWNGFELFEHYGKQLLA